MSFYSNFSFQSFLKNGSRAKNKESERESFLYEKNMAFPAVFRIRNFLALLDLDSDLDPAIIKQKIVRKALISTIL
jgi:hypothetical protein